MKKPNLLWACFFMLLLSLSVKAQVKIGDNPNSINANSLLELESTNKGFLPPRVALNSTVAVAPLTGTVPAGMLVYSTGGTLPDGYYYWNSTSWRLVATSDLNAVAKTASATLTKTETFVLASNDIVLTLPAITSSDNGLAFTIKNIGSHTDLIVIKGNGASKIDGRDSSTLTRWFGKTFIAYGGNWVEKEKKEGIDNLLDVSPEGSWTTIQEAIEFLNIHMSGAAVIRLSGGSFPIDQTQVIDLDYPLTIQGLSYSKATIEAEAGLSGPMFNCLSECYFKMLAFSTEFGSTAGNDAILLDSPEEYYEIKDCTFEGFNKTIVLKSNVELWLFETDINDAVTAGVEIAAGAESGVTLKASETDFINCDKGINMLSGVAAVTSILNCGFYNEAGQIGVDYVPTSFTDFASMFITNNSWNNIGTFFNGFDYSRSDGRDAEIFVQNNAGDGDKNPTCRINVNSNSTATTITNAATWYKAYWVNTSATTIKWTIGDNKITYQPSNRKDGYAIITGNISVNQPNTTISIGIVKNGINSTRIGETDLRLKDANQPYQFSTVIYFSDIAKNDYLELYCTSPTSNGVGVTFQDVQWFTDTK